MADNESIVKLKLDADLTGGLQTEKQYDRLKAKAAKLGKDSSASVGEVTSAFGRLRGAMGLVKNVLTGFGVVGVFTALAAAVGKVKDSFGAAKKEAEALAKEKDKAAHKEAVEALAKSYETLGESMRKASEAMQRANELEDIATRNARALEDAQLDLAKQKELAAIDANDPAAAEKRAQIEANYAERRGHLTAARSREDLARESNRLMAEAGAKRTSAGRIEKEAEEYDRLIESAQKRRDATHTRSFAMNEEDRHGFWENFGGVWKDVATLNWGHIGESDSEAGNALRKEAKGEVAALDAEIKRLQEEKRQKLKQAADLRAEAEHMDERAGAIYAGQKAIDVREDATAVETRRGVVSAGNALDKKEKQVAKDKQTIAEGKETLANFEETEAEQKAKAQAAADKYQKEQNEVFAAQNRYDMLVQNGGSKKEKSAALAALQKEKAEALEAQHEMEKVAAEVANVLKAIKEEVGTLSRSVKAAQSRLKQNEADAPEG